MFLRNVLVIQQDFMALVLGKQQSSECENPKSIIAMSKLMIQPPENYLAKFCVTTILTFVKKSATKDRKMRNEIGGR
jgi:hypothetical protein